jgi:apolipoprotein N-acyltransferase
VALAWGYGAARIHALEARMAAAPALRVGLVQGNLGVLEKRGDAALVHRRYLEQTRELLADAAENAPSPALDLVVWPETVYSRGLQLPLPISGRFVREDLRVPLLFGGATVEAEGGRRVRRNGALLVGVDGVIRDAYAKNLLIPLAEYVPFAERWPRLAAALPHAQEFSAAADTPPLSLGPWRISTPICYEAVRPAFVRRMVRRADPHLIATLANDAWFGDSQEPRLHLAVARLRAVEHHLYLVRATNSGISAVVDPLGRVVARTGLLARENLRATLQPLGGRTLYARAGDWPGWLAVAIALPALAVPRPARGRSRP